MSWAYSPSYGKPLSVPQGMIGLMSRFGMDIVLAHPQGYDVMSETRDVATKFATESGGSFRVTHDMADAFEGADIVCPKSWAPFAAMEERTELYGNGDSDGIKALEKRLLAQNAPGTYSHSLMISQMAEEAAESVGAASHCPRTSGPSRWSTLKMRW